MRRDTGTPEMPGGWRAAAALGAVVVGFVTVVALLVWWAS